MTIGGVITNTSKIINGAAEVLNLLRTLGEGYRLSCMYRCQVLNGDYRNKEIDHSGIAYNFYLMLLDKQDALDVYMKLPHKHYNTGWVLSQVPFFLCCGLLLCSSYADESCEFD